MEGVFIAAARLQAVFAIATAIVLSVACIASAITFSTLGSKFFDSATRQPELIGALATRFLIIAGMFEIAIIGALGFSFLGMFMSPFLLALKSFLVV